MANSKLGRQSDYTLQLIGTWRVTWCHCTAALSAYPAARCPLYPRACRAVLLYKMILVFAWRFVVFDLLLRRRRVLIVNSKPKPEPELELELELNLNVAVVVVVAFLPRVCIVRSFRFIQILSVKFFCLVSSLTNI